MLHFNGLLVYLADKDAIDRNWIKNHVAGFEDALEAARRFAPSLEIGATLGAGTNCGSCIPGLKKLLAAGGAQLKAVA